MSHASSRILWVGGQSASFSAVRSALAKEFGGVPLMLCASLDAVRSEPGAFEGALGLLFDACDRERLAATMRALLVKGDLPPVVVVTDHAPLADVAALLEGGADAVCDVNDPDRVAVALLMARRSARDRATLQALARSASAATVVIDAAGQVVFESEGAASLGLGGRTSAVILPGADGRDPDLSAAAALSVADGTAAQRLAMIDERGREVSVERLVTPVRMLGAQGAVVQHLDLTQRLDLERKVAALLKADTVGQLSRAVVHDLNNVFCVVQSFCDLLLQTLDPEDPRYEDVQEIARAGSRATSLTQRLVTFSRRPPGRAEPLNAGEALRRIEPLAKRLLGERGEVAMSVSESNITALFDPALFDQVVLDALTIARASAGERLVVAIDLAQDESGVLLRFSFVPEVDGERVELDDTRTDALRSLLASGGGHLRETADPVPTAELRLPRSPRALSGTDPPRASRSPETVLVIEDEASVRVAMTRVLASLGYQVRDARRGDDARGLAERAPFDLIITDVVLPDGDGVRLLDDLLRREPRSKGLIVTGYADAEIGRVGDRVPLLRKPFSTIDLARKVREALDGP